MKEKQLTFDRELLSQSINAFVRFELAEHNVDPRLSLNNTVLRRDEDEYYKQILFHEWKDRVRKTDQSRSQIVLEAMKAKINGIPNNLVDYRQIRVFQNAMQSEKATTLEKALDLIFAGNNDEDAFEMLASVVGSKFDLVSFVFFLKGGDYMPCRPRNFDDRFRRLGLQSGLEGHCTWVKYQQFNGWIQELQEELQDSLNKDISRLDAHSFLWALWQVQPKPTDALKKSRSKKNTASRQSAREKRAALEAEEEEARAPGEIKPGERVPEGAKKQITVNAHERNPKARLECKKHYLRNEGRLVCQICGFDFGTYYGPEYKNKIHIHHLIPLKDIGEEYMVDPVKDLLPVCPNCHLVLHAGNGISVEDLKKKLGK